jgi:hypothetical protein
VEDLYQDQVEIKSKSSEKYNLKLDINIEELDNKTLALASYL